MKVRLLPSNCHKPTQYQSLTTYLIDGWLAIDGGSLGYGLSPDEQLSVREVILTHAHSDHCASLPIFVAEVFPFLKSSIGIYGTEGVLHTLRQNLFNGSIWPDFTEIMLTDGSAPSLCFHPVEIGRPFEVRNLRITPVEVNHIVPTIGLAIEDDRSAVVFTSDTYCTDGVWQLANSIKHLKAIFVDTSYPNEEGKLAEVSKHLTPELLEAELRKLDGRGTIYAVHLKPQYRHEVIHQLSKISTRTVEVAEINREYDW